MKRLSVIIPIYNVEPFIERCLRSIENQNISADDFEVICINDGSPDNSREVVLRLQKEYRNIKLLEQENQGVSKARNNGIDMAKGRYLLFIDPDDYVNENRFSRILHTAEDLDAEVSFLGFSVINEDGSVRSNNFNEGNRSKIFKGIDAYNLARSDGRTDPDRMWAILFNRKFLLNNNFQFLPDVPYLEDGELIARILCLAERCVFDGFSFYQRTTRPGSATNSKLFHSEKARNGFLIAASNLKKFQNEKNLNDRQKAFLNQPILKFALLSINSALELGRFNKLNDSINVLKESGLGKIKLEGCNSYYRSYGRAYNLSPWLAAFELIIYPRVIFYLHHLIKRN